MKKVYKIKFREQWCIIEGDLDVVLDEVRVFSEEASVGETIEISVEEMTEKELLELPEFMGW